MGQDPGREEIHKTDGGQIGKTEDTPNWPLPLSDLYVIKEI